MVPISLNPQLSPNSFYCEGPGGLPWPLPPVTRVWRLSNLFEIDSLLEND